LSKESGRPEPGVRRPRRSARGSRPSRRDASVFSPPSITKSVPFTNATPRSPAALCSALTSVPGGKRHPHEIAAFRRHRLGLWQLARERPPERQSAIGQCGLDRLDRAVDRARGAELVDDRLRGPCSARYTCSSRASRSPRSARPGRPSSRRGSRADGLRERRGVDHVLRVHREHRRQRLPAEAQVYVWVVLKHPESCARRPARAVPGAWPARACSRRGSGSWG